MPNIAPCYIIKGNKETYQLNGLGENHPEWDAYPSTIGMIRYGSQHLTGRDLDYLKGLDSKKYLVVLSCYYNRPNHPPIPVIIYKM